MFMFQMVLMLGILLKYSLMSNHIKEPRKMVQQTGSHLFVATRCKRSGHRTMRHKVAYKLLLIILFHHKLQPQVQHQFHQRNQVALMHLMRHFKLIMVES
nr:MAG TPA: hypothetical protein [Caudoviricetes sp.]